MQTKYEKKTKLCWMNPRDIDIPSLFIEKGCNEWKIEERIDYYNKYGSFDKPIEVSRKGYCTDGYSRLCAALWIDLDKVLVAQYI